MGTIAIQTQCCLSKTDDEYDDDGGDGAEEESTAVQLVAPLPWHGRGGRAGRPVSPPPATNLSRYLSETSTIFFAPQQQQQQQAPARRA